MAVRPLVVPLEGEDREKLRLIAERRRMVDGDLAAWLLTCWLRGPGRQELARILLGHDERPRRRRGPAGQLELSV